MKILLRTSDKSTSEAPLAQRHLRLVRARQAALDAWPIWGSQLPDHPAIDFTQLQALLGFHDQEFASICHKINDGAFRASVMIPSAGPAHVSNLSANADIWFGVNPVRGPARTGGKRGKAEDVTRLSALFADLDVKDGGCPDLATCWAIIDDLSGMLGTRPVAVVASGHGLQPYWAISDGERDSAAGAGMSLTVTTRRWGRLVAAVAGAHSAAVDSVSELARVLRVPNTFNCKDVANGGQRIAVTCEADPNAVAVTLAHVGGVLDSQGVRPEESDSDTRQVFTKPSDWKFGDKTCDYVAALVDGIASDGPNPNGVSRGRHQWMMHQCVRLASAYRLKCITEADLVRALKTLHARLGALRAATGEVVTAFEVTAGFDAACEKVSRKTNAQAKDELGDHHAAGGSGKSEATMLVDLALASFKFGISPDSKPFAYTDDSPHVALYLHSRKFGLKSILAGDYYRKYNSAPSDTSLRAALNILEGEARKLAPTKLWVRVAGDRTRIHLDMADDDNRVIEISDGDWRIVDTSPHMFRRTELIAAQNEPVVGGELDKLWQFVNIEELDRPLLLAVMVDALINPETAKPITALLAEHGSAKTTTGRCIVNLVDPSTAALRSPPSELGTWITAGAGSWVIGVDNLSSIPDWLSDAMCRAATGDGDVRRELYTDGDLTVFNFLRPVIFTGIFMHFNQDLADRMVEISLRTIGDNRREEEEFKTAWLEDQPVILGGLLSLAAKVQQKLPGMKVEKLPRMADYARVLACIDEIEGTQGLKRYREVLARSAVASANDDSFIARILQLRFNTDAFNPNGMTATEVLQNVTFDFHVDKPADWPKKAQTVSARLTRNAPALRGTGWTVANDGGANHDKVMRWTLRPPVTAGDGNAGTAGR